MADEPAAEDPHSLAGLTWPSARTLFRFFVAWDSEDNSPCHPDAESRQQAISTTQSLLTCLDCGEVRSVGVEIAEVVI